MQSHALTLPFHDIAATTTGAVLLPGEAAYDAARQIKERLVEFACGKWQVEAKDVEFLPNRVRIGGEIFTFGDFVKQAYFGRVQLSAAGFYKTPKIHWDRAAGRGTTNVTVPLCNRL